MASPETDTGDLAEGPAEEPKAKLSLDVKIDKPSACERHVTVSVGREDVERYFREALDELQPKAEVPGFRPGRAPRKIVEARFRSQVAGQVKNQLLMDSMMQVSEEHEFSAISEPDIDPEAVVLPDEGPLTFEFDLEVRPEFQVPEWKGLALQKPAREFSEQDVDRQFKKVLERYGRLVPHEGPAQQDDFLVAHVTCTHDGQVVSELRDLTLQIKPVLSFPDGKLEGFDQVVSGARPGDRRQAQMVVSAEADNEPLRGQQVELQLEVLEVKKLELPELNRAFLERIGGFASEQDLRNAVRQELERQRNYQQQRWVRQQVQHLLAASADWELPPELLKRQAQRELERAVMELQSAGFSEEDIQAHAHELRRNSLATTATSLKEHFILEAIAEQEDIEATEDDFDREIELLAKHRNEPARRVRARLEKRGQMDSLRNQVIERKVLQRILDHAQFQEVPWEPETRETTTVDHPVSSQTRTAEIPKAKHPEEAESFGPPRAPS